MNQTPGFIHDPLDLKILLLLILRRLPLPADKDLLFSLAQCDGGVTFFDFAECLEDLKQSGHVAEEDSLWFVTEKGKENGEALERSLPISLRTRVSDEADKAAQALRRKNLLSASRRKRPDGGYDVLLNLGDGNGQLMKLELFAGSEAEARRMERRFLTDAEALYLKLCETLLQDDAE